MDYYFHLLSLISIYLIIALALNLIVGYLGILNLGHTGFYAIGAYTFAILMRESWVSFFPALLVGGLIAALSGLVLALPTLRLRSHYIAITTLGFGIIVFGLIINLPDLTRGALGIPGIPRPSLFGYTFLSTGSYALFTSVLAIIIAFIFHRILHSPFGRVIEAIREDEISAKTLGKNTIFYKIQAFVLSAFFAGIGGGLLASLLGFINAWNFTIDELLRPLAIVIVGGMGSFWGTVVGTIFIILIPEPLRFLNLESGIIGPLRFAIYGLLLILFMLFRPNGLLGKRKNIFSK